MNNTYKVINPYTQEVFYHYEFTSSSEVAESISKLKNSTLFKDTSKYQRSKKLNRLGQLIAKNQDMICDILTQEIGKTNSEAKAEVTRAITLLECAADYLRTSEGELLNSDQYSESQKNWGIIERFPIGTILCITPFNFPINLAVHKIAPALAMGNTVLLKPHPQCFRSSQLLIDLCHQAGFKEQDIQFICPHHEVLQEFLDSSDINAISFTGGFKTAKQISKSISLKKELYELGGNGAIVIYADADLEQAAQTAIDHRFGFAGQRCTASKRVFIHNSVYEKVKEIILTKAKNIVFGDPRQPQVNLGPVISVESAKLIESQINSLKDEGARVLYGGERDKAIISPCIMENISLQSETMKEEIFGPVLPLYSFEGDSDLITQVNSTQYGLQCGVFTNDLSKVKNLFHNINVGSLIINNGPAYRSDHFPFGGVKNSGIGREGIKYAMNEMSYIKSLII